MITATQEPPTTEPTTGPPVGPSTAEVVAALPSERLEAEIVSLARRLSAGTYELLVLVGELDARGTWVTFGALSAFLQYDHIQPYAHGGPTTIANLQKLCGPHNRRRTSYSSNNSSDER